MPRLGAFVLSNYFAVIYVPVYRKNCSSFGISLNFHLFHARVYKVPPTQSLAIPQIVNIENDQYGIGYQVVKARAGRHPAGRITRHHSVKHDG